jgi:mRNA interferase MazF
MVRGEIWWANLPPPAGSAPAKRRPVLIIQGDSFNRSAIDTVICAMITSNVDLAAVPGTVLLEKSVSGLDITSVINFSQIATLDKSDLTGLAGTLPRHMVKKADDALKLTLDIQ